MSIFKRKQRADDADAVDGDDAVDAADATGSDRAPVGGGGRIDGPFDVAEVGGPDGDGREGRLDIGALWLPLVDGLQVQLQVDEAAGTVTGAFLVLGEAAVQVQAFAAPRSEGIWREVADEIAAGISEQGGTADPGTGPFGHELLGRVPTAMPDGRTGFQPLRFTGVDGPRWMLRAVFHGAAAVDPAAARPLEDVVRGVVVVRGSEPMGPRELLPLQLPDDAQVAPAGDDDEAGDELGGADARPAGYDDLQPFERGPEITERR